MYGQWNCNRWSWLAHSLVWKLVGEGISVSRISFKYLKLSQSQKARVGKGRWWFVLHSHTSLSSRGQLQRRPNKSLRNVFVRLCARPNPAPTAPTCIKGGLYSRPRRVCVGGQQLDSYAGSGKAKPALQSVLHMWEPPTFSLRIAQTLVHIYSPRNIHRDGRALLQLCCFLLF